MFLNVARKNGTHTRPLAGLCSYFISISARLQASHGLHEGQDPVVRFHYRTNVGEWLLRSLVLTDVFQNREQWIKRLKLRAVQRIRIKRLL